MGLSPVLAHAGHGSGVDLEYLVLGGALMVLAILLYVQKSAPLVVSVVLVLVALALGSGAFMWGGS